MTEKIDYNKSYSFRQNESATQKKNIQDEQQVQQNITSEFRQSSTNYDFTQENPLSQYKILLQLSSQLLLENTVSGKRVIYKEFAIPQKKGIQELQSELMRRKAIDCNNILKLNLFLIEKQQTLKPISDQKFGVVFDNFIRDFDSELETRKANKKYILSSMKENGVVLHNKDQIHQGLQIMSKVNNIQLFWTEEELLNTLESVLLGICELHKNKIIHGDFNASSVVFCDDGFVKIADQFVTNPDFYQKEKVQQFQQSLLPPENTFYTTEGDFWAIGMVFLEAAILEASQDLYQFQFESLQNCQENQPEQIYQINFKLLQSRIQDLVLLSQNQSKQNQLQIVLNLLLSQEPSKRKEALLYFETLKHYYSSYQVENNQICQIKKINSQSNISESQIQTSKIQLNQKIPQQNQEILDYSNQSQMIEQKIPCMKISLSPHKSVIQAHKQQLKNQKSNQQFNLNFQILECQNKDNCSSNLSFCTQSSSSQTSKERNTEKDMQISVNSKILKQNSSIKNKVKGLQRNQNVKNLDEICNIGISIPSLEVSPIVNDIYKPYKDQLQQVKTIIKQEKENTEKNCGLINQRQKKAKEQYPQKSQHLQNMNVIENKNKRNQISKQDNKENLGNMSMQSRSSTMIDFYLSNPSNKNGLESPQNLSFESQSCKSQSNQNKLVYNYFKSQKNKNNESELNFIKEDKIKKHSQQKISQSLNNSIDYINHFKESAIQLQRDKSQNSNRKNEKENRVFLQEQSNTQQSNRLVDQKQKNYTQNNQNKFNFEATYIQQNQQEGQQQQQSYEHNIQQQQQQQQLGAKNEESQIKQRENQMNDRVRSQLSIKKQYSTLSNLIDSCLQRSRSLTSSCINRSQSMQERNTLNSSFQNTSNYQSQLNNSLNSISVKLQTSTKKSSLQDQQKNEQLENNKYYTAEYENYKKYSDNYEIDQERQFQSNASVEIQKNNLNQNFHSNQPSKGLQESPIQSNRRNLPPKSTSRSSKKGMKQDLNNSLNQQSLQDQGKQNKININFKQIDQMSIQIQPYQPGFKDKSAEISQTNNQNIQTNNQSIQIQQDKINKINSVNREINVTDQEINSNLSQNIYSEVSQQSVEDIKSNSQQLFNQSQQENISLSKDKDQQSIINQQEVQIDNIQVQLSEQLSSDSFQVFKVSEQSTHREKEASCKKLNINDLRSQLEQTCVLQNILKKPTPQNIQIRIQNFIYDDDWVSYDGQYFNNTFSGVGFLKLKNNCSYHGEFLMGKLNGYGSFYIGQQNAVVLGYFQNNILIKKCN
ncbi:hypothetical protein ABPG74_000139 [Tetrahymena malaccensis]